MILSSKRQMKEDNPAAANSEMPRSGRNGRKVTKGSTRAPNSVKQSDVSQSTFIGKTKKEALTILNGINSSIASTEVVAGRARKGTKLPPRADATPGGKGVSRRSRVKIKTLDTASETPKTDTKVVSKQVKSVPKVASKKAKSVPKVASRKATSVSKSASKKSRGVTKAAPKKKAKVAVVPRKSAPATNVTKSNSKVPKSSSSSKKATKKRKTTSSMKINDAASETASDDEDRAHRSKKHQPNNTSHESSSGLEAKLPRWAKSRKLSSISGWENHFKHLVHDGYTVIRDLFSPDCVDTLLHGKDPVLKQQSSRRSGRARNSTQEWHGAVKTMLAHLSTDGGTETVLSPLATRGLGRYDMPLPPHVRSQVEEILCDAGVMKFLKFLCPRGGKLRAQDVLLSRPGSERQSMHTDSSWEGKISKDPAPHYFTVLVPLTLQDAATGGTRVWPGSHRDREMPILENSGYVDCVTPVLNIGDGLLFNGLLCHCGMENVSGFVDDHPRDRYFYYAAFSTIHDPNTEVTGI